jgi:hypothetical protein
LNPSEERSLDLPVGRGEPKRVQGIGRAPPGPRNPGRPGGLGKG